MDSGDIGAVQIAAGLFGSVSLGTTVFLLMQMIKGLVGERMNGPEAEYVVIGTSLVAVLLAMLAVDTDWRERTTYVALVIGTLSATVIARGLYSQLFKVSVEGVPVSPDASVSRSAVHDSSDPYESAPRRPIAHARAMTDDEITIVEKRTR
ncbi:MAG: hypothetical protein M3440_12685 [Chloroflexota bacterium]|nr:hypothetical protein [Chloroflexota bacterium]